MHPIVVCIWRYILDIFVLLIEIRYTEISLRVPDRQQQLRLFSGLRHRISIFAKRTLQ